MKKEFLVIYLISFISSCIFAQTSKLIVEEDTQNGNARNVLIIHNKASGTHASTSLKLMSGENSTLNTASIGISNSLYTAVPSIAGYLNLTSGSSTTGGSGINFRCADTFGNFQYFIGGYSDSDLKLILDSSGNLGISTNDPKSKLQVSDGDIYIEDINSGVIMKSPNGQCWRMTIDDTGSSVNTAIICPN